MAAGTLVVQRVGRLRNTEIRLELVLAGFFLLVFIALYFYRYVENYHINRATNDWASRATLASHAGDMRQYIDNAIQGMENWGFTQGNAALFFKAPANDMKITMLQLQRARERAASLEKAYLASSPPQLTSVEYNQALDDLRSNLTSMTLMSNYYYWVHDGLPISIMFYLSIALIIVLLIRPLMLMVR